MKKLFSIVLPIYKNELNIPITIPYIIEHLDLFPDYQVEIIMVNDGSPDNSYEEMKKYQKQYPELIRIASFARNYGQRAAVNYGMKMAKGDVVGVISADLQDPFELFPELLKKWEQGTALVYGEREARAEKGLGAFCSNLMHRMIQKHINASYPKGGFDFFVADRKLCDAFIEHDTKNNSMQLLLLSLAPSHESILYTRRKRTEGKSGWNLARKIDQALNIFVTYTDYPIRMIGKIGAWQFGIGCIALILGIVLTAVLKQPVLLAIAGAGLALLLSGGIWIVLFLIGEYNYKNLESLKKMPRYVIQEQIEKG